MSLVDCVIPAHNEEKYIEGAIASANHITDVNNITVVENNSTDSTYDRAQQTGATVLQETQPGPSAAKNKGYKNTNADWILFLDADARLDKPHQTKKYLTQTNADLLTLPLKPIKNTPKNNLVVAYKNTNNTLRDFLNLPYGNGNATIIRRNAADHIKETYGDLFDESRLTREDTNLIHRAQQTNLRYERPFLPVQISMRVYEENGHLTQVINELLEKFDNRKRTRWNIPNT